MLSLFYYTFLYNLFFVCHSSGIMWQVKKPGKSRYKRMKEDIIYKVEEAYSKYQNECDLKADVSPVVTVTDKVKVSINTYYA